MVNHILPLNPLKPFKSSTIVAYAICPSVNTFFIFHIFKIEKLKNWQCEYIQGSTYFSFQTKILQFF